MSNLKLKFSMSLTLLTKSTGLQRVQLLQLRTKANVDLVGHSQPLVQWKVLTSLLPDNLFLSLSQTWLTAHG